MQDILGVIQDGKAGGAEHGEGLSRQILRAGIFRRDQRPLREDSASGLRGNLRGKEFQEITVGEGFNGQSPFELPVGSFDGNGYRFGPFIDHLDGIRSGPEQVPGQSPAPC